MLVYTLLAAGLDLGHFVPRFHLRSPTLGKGAPSIFHGVVNGDPNVVLGPCRP